MTSNHNNELLSLSRQKWTDMAAKDTARLGALFHEEAIFVHMGATFTKTEELEIISSGRIHYRQVDIEEISARIIGSTGIVLTTLTMHSTVSDHEVTNPFAVTEVYVQDGETWRLGAMSFTRLITPESNGSS
jgi:hypothetical protein